MKLKGNLNHLKALFVALLLTLSSFSIQAQQDQGGDIFQQSMNDMIVVGAIGGAGALLGLSTLSFVEEPSEHLKNIVVGGAIGIIVGVGVVAYKQANVSQELYQGRGEASPSENPEMTTAMRTAWHQRNHYQINDNLGNQSPSKLQGVNFQFSF